MTISTYSSSGAPDAPLRRLMAALATIALTLFGLVLLTFVLARFLPEDPVIAIMGDTISGETYDRVYRELGLDQPIHVQFFTYLGRVLSGDLGMSHITGMPVATDLMRVFPATLELAILATFVGAVVGIPLGVAAATHRGSIIDHLVRIIGLIGYSVPIFWLALIGLIVFYAGLGWVGGSGRIDVLFTGAVPPVTGLLLLDSALAGDWAAFGSAFRHIVLPASLLGYHSVAYVSRMTRSFMLEQLGQEYVVTARVKGLSQSAVVWRHAFRNIRVQLLTIVALTFGAMLDGSVLVETVFAWPGLGQYLTRGLMQKDMNVVLGCVLLIGVVFLVVNKASDLLYGLLDPRARPNPSGRQSSGASRNIK